MRFPLSLRWFLIVSPSPPLVVVLIVLAVGSAVLEILDRGSSDWVLASIALIQLFAVSTGFTRHAGRGYYDPVLPGRSRFGLALAHLGASASPGVLAWVACGIAQGVAARTADVPAFRAEGWAALVLVSGVPWAASVRAAPLVGGALWLLISISLLISGRALVLLARLQADPAWADEHPALAFGAGLAFPPIIPSLQWPPRVLVGFLAVALFAVSIGAVAVARADFALAEEGA